MLEDPEPPRTRQLVPPAALDGMGIAELQDYIAALQTEITRAEATITQKRSHRGAADSVFRT